MPTFPGQPTVLTLEQRDDLSCELRVMEENVRVMTALLTEVSPARAEKADLELLQVSGSVPEDGDVVWGEGMCV